MSKKTPNPEIELVDRAKQRMMFDSAMDKVKNVALFIVVAIILSWLILGM